MVSFIPFLHWYLNEILYEIDFSFLVVSADYDGDRAQFFKKEAFQAFRLMDDRSPDYYISYKTQHDDQDRNLSWLPPFCAKGPTEVYEYSF